jgi:hypothetical protein
MLALVLCAALRWDIFSIDALVVPSISMARRTPPTSPSALAMAAFSLDPSSTALVFIEYQNEFTTEGGKLNQAVKDCMTKTNSKSPF